MFFIDIGLECLDFKCEELFDMVDWVSRGVDVLLLIKECFLRFLVCLEWWKG